jgi:hypothetical protein
MLKLVYSKNHYFRLDRIADELDRVVFTRISRRIGTFIGKCKVCEKVRIDRRRLAGFL